MGVDELDGEALVDPVDVELLDETSPRDISSLHSLIRNPNLRSLRITGLVHQ